MKPCAFCQGNMVEIYRVKRVDGGFGKPVMEHHLECEYCGFHGVFTEILEKADKEEKQIMHEALRRLGYVEGRDRYKNC